MPGKIDLRDDAGEWRPSPWLEWGAVVVIALVFAGALRAVILARGE